MYQVVGFLAVGAAGAAILHSWDLPRFVSCGFALLSLSGAGMVSASHVQRVEGPSEPISYVVAADMPPTEGVVAPLRRQKPAAESALW